MTNSDGQDVIVGKSVEEIEADSSNRVNSPVEGENRRDDADTMIPAVPLGVASSGITGAGTAGGGLVGVIAVAGSADGLTDHSSGADDGREQNQRDSSEE